GEHHLGFVRYPSSARPVRHWCPTRRSAPAHERPLGVHLFGAALAPSTRLGLRPWLPFASGRRRIGAEARLRFALAHDPRGRRAVIEAVLVPNERVATTRSLAA